MYKQIVMKEPDQKWLRRCAYATKVAHGGILL